jgi:hypothetical protein
MALHVEQELLVDASAIGFVPVTGAVAPVEQLQVAIPEVVATT